MRAARDGWWVAAVALVARATVAFWAAARIPPTADGHYYHRLATRLAEGEGYTWLWPDGVVTAAAHYPVGYPAMIAGAYALVGANPAVAMAVNALVGTAGCVALWAVLRRHHGRRAALAGGLLAALHPGLVAYTPALMTEGIVAALWGVAAWLAGASVGSSSTRRRLLWLVAGAVVMGLATLVRPQSILLAPLVGVVALPAAPWRGGLLASALAVTVCLPWTLRNCEQMGRCAFVSVNGGWNLLIGTNPEGQGGWAPLEVPDACRTVYDEAAKDRCFERAARRKVIDEPWRWLGLVPAKLSVTFDYCGAAGWYLHEASPDDFGARSKVVIGVVETLYERLLLAAALLAAWWRGRRAARGRWRARLRGAALILGLLSTVGVHAAPAWLALMALLASCRWTWTRPTWAFTLGGVASLFVVHAVFFGAGRYQLVIWIVIIGVATDGWTLARRWVGLRLARRRAATSGGARSVPTSARLASIPRRRKVLPRPHVDDASPRGGGLALGDGARALSGGAGDGV